MNKARKFMRRFMLFRAGTALQWPYLHTMNKVEKDATAFSICRVAHFLPQANMPLHLQTPVWPATCACIDIALIYTINKNHCSCVCSYTIGC